MAYFNNQGYVTNQAEKININHQTNNYHSTEQKTPPIPSSIIPFERDDAFVDRGTLLNQIRDRTSVPGSWTALAGLGGVGKSQLAIEHAYQTRKRSPETWVFWVHASNAARFEQSYRDIADRVEIPGRQDLKANIFQLVHDWLCNGNARWQLILDNLDDARFLLEGQANGRSQVADLGNACRPLQDYLPQCEYGSILVTTRNKEAALELVERHNIIAVGPMNKSQAQALFEKKLGAQEGSIEVGELAMALDYMPLAIVQAAAYITQRCSVRQYLGLFRKSEGNKTSLLLQRETGKFRRDREAKNSIMVTWEISFQYIYDNCRSAANLLSLMSFFDRQGIPEELLRSRGEEQGNGEGGKKERGDDHQDSNGDDNDDDDTSQSSKSENGVEDEVKDQFGDDVLTLQNFCFISIDRDGNFEMHALVQLATRKWLTANGTLERWKQQFVSSLCIAFPTGEYENWARCQALFAHAKAAAGQKPEGESSLAQWATLLYRAAWFALDIGNIGDGKELAVKSMEVRRKVLGAEHEDTLWSMWITGEAYRLGGRWKKAEKLEVQVMETSKTKLGNDHPSTLTSMANLASTMKGLGNHDRAISMMNTCVDLRKRVLGAHHPHTVSSLVTLIKWRMENEGTTRLS